MMQQLLADYLVNAAWQAPLVALCAFAICRFAGLSPRSRHGLWLGFLALAAVLPAISLAAVLPHALPTVARVPADTALAAAAVAAAPHARQGLAPALALAPWSAGAMIGLFAAVAVTLTARLAMAAAAARRLVGQSEPFALPAQALQAVERLARAHGRRAPPIRRSARLSSPAVVGAFSPVILIPEAMAATAAERGEDLRAALLHEMAHVLRHDYAVNLVCELLTLPVSWHPALAALKAGVSRSREAACDAIAAAAMASPKAYAQCLVSLAQSLGGPSHGGPSHGRASAPASAALAVGLFGRSDLEERLMQLMKPADAEAPVLRAARLCGLAALGAGLLGSAALLHVTPVFAQGVFAQGQPAPVAVTAAPLPPPAAAAASQARQDAAKPLAPHHRSGLMFSSKGVLIQTGEDNYRHSFKAADGRTVTVYTDDPNDPSPEQQRQWEAAARDAEAKADAAEKMVNSPEFKARIAQAEARAAEAEKRVNSPEFKARIAQAEARAAEAEKRVNSPEFKARIAKAQADAEAAAKMVSSPEFQDRISRARGDAAQARAEARASLAEARAQRRAAAEQMQRDLETPPTPNAPPAP